MVFEVANRRNVEPLPLLVGQSIYEVELPLPDLDLRPNTIGYDTSFWRIPTDQLLKLRNALKIQVEPKVQDVQNIQKLNKFDYVSSSDLLKVYKDELVSMVKDALQGTGLPDDAISVKSVGNILEVEVADFLTKDKFRAIFPLGTFKVQIGKEGNNNPATKINTAINGREKSESSYLVHLQKYRLDGEFAYFLENVRTAIYDQKSPKANPAQELKLNHDELMTLINKAT